MNIICRKMMSANVILFATYISAKRATDHKRVIATTKPREKATSSILRRSYRFPSRPLGVIADASNSRFEDF